MVRHVAALTLICTAFALPAAAQQRPAPAIELSGGALMFPDDGSMVTEGFVGGNGRFYVSPRVSVGPEIVYINGSGHSHLMATGNVTFDLVSPGATVTPFVVAGGGMFLTRETGPFNGTSSHTEGAFTAGGGVRGQLGDHVIVGAELRTGWETHLRVNGFVGLRLGR